MSAIKAIQTLYEHGQPPLVMDPMDRDFETTNDVVHYLLPQPNEDGSGVFEVDVWICCLGGAGAQQWSILGNKDYVDLVDWNGPYVRELADGTDAVEVELLPNGDYTGDAINVGCIAIFPTRARTELPEAELDHGATPVDVAMLVDTKALSVHRVEDSRKQAAETYRRQFRSAIQASGHHMPDTRTIVVEVEVPESTTKPEATLNVACYGIGGSGPEELHIEAEGQTVDLPAGFARERGTITVQTARDGQIRPYRIPVKLTLDTDATITGFSAWWSKVDP